MRRPTARYAHLSADPLRASAWQLLCQVRLVILVSISAIYVRARLVAESIGNRLATGGTNMSDVFRCLERPPTTEKDAL
jgi:hypothetical protein